MRRFACFVVLAAVLLGACGGDDSSGDDAVVDRTRAIPADVQAFLARVVTPQRVRFTADYSLLNKNGGGEHVVHVTSPPVQVSIDGAQVDLDDDAKLSSFGIFSGFLAANPKAAIAASARRADAGDAELSHKTVAGQQLDCIVIPVQDARTSMWCLTTQGVFGFVDNPSVHYELTSWTTG